MVASFYRFVILSVMVTVFCSCKNVTNDNHDSFIDKLNLFLAFFTPNDYTSDNNEYINKTIDLAVDGKIDSIDLQLVKTLDQIYISNNDSFNACASNFVIGVVNYHISEYDTALIYLLNAEQLSNSRQELRPHIYYYLASAFLEYDPILAHDVILSHPNELISKYDYSKFLDINVSQRDENMHNVNSLYYSRLIQQSLDSQDIQHQKEKHLYIAIIISVFSFFILALLSIFLIIRHKHKTNILADSIANQKGNFNALLEKYIVLYGMQCDVDSVIRDANELLSALRDEFSLSKSDVSIIWLLLLSFDKDRICLTLNITEVYYSQRRTKIRKALGFSSTRNLENDLKTFVPEYLLEHSL